jgi:hypothetical protein
MDVIQFLAPEVEEITRSARTEHKKRNGQQLHHNRENEQRKAGVFV